MEKMHVNYHLNKRYPLLLACQWEEGRAGMASFEGRYGFL
jgi:hypothetical protein